MSDIPVLCRNCKWWVNEGDDWYGYCHHHSPVVLVISSEVFGQIERAQTGWPLTKHDDFCCDFLFSETIQPEPEPSVYTTHDLPECVSEESKS